MTKLQGYCITGTITRLFFLTVWVANTTASTMTYKGNVIPPTKAPCLLKGGYCTCKCGLSYLHTAEVSPMVKMISVHISFAWY